MKKNILFLSVVVSAALFMVSCEGNDPDKNGNGGNETEKFDPSNGKMPIKWSDNIAEGTDVGVTIEVTKVENENFVFELRPGSKVKSYRMDVFPLALLYNSLLNDGYLGKSTWEIAEAIRSYIFSSNSSGGFTFSIEDEEGGGEDFLQKQFDWANTTYAAVSAVPVPDADYIIAVVGCTDTAADVSCQEELTLCRVHTTSAELVGDPSCEINVNIGYRKFAVQHLPNPDCKYLYYYGSHADQFDEYIDAFGDVMFRDFLRSTTTAPYDVSDPESLIYNFDFGQYADSDLLSCTAVICLDENRTPAAMYQRKDFRLKKIPANAEGAEAELVVQENSIAANYFNIEATIEANCNTIFYRTYDKETADEIMAASDDQKALLAYDIYVGGYGCHNPNFLFDEEEEVPCGSQGNVTLPQYGDYLAGETYRVVYICRNAYGTLSDLKFTDEFTMDDRNLDSNASCNVKDFSLKLSSPSRQKFMIEVEYDPETVSIVYISYFYEGNSPSCAASREWKDWVDFIFTQSEYGTGGINPVNANISTWCRMDSGYDPFWLTGLQPDTEYTVFCCAEDFDGNVSEVLFETITTEAIQAGPDPTMSLSLSRSDSYGEDWSVSYSIVKDVARFKYALVDNISDISSYIPGITVSDLNDLASSSFGYETCKEGFYNFVLELGLSTYSDTNQGWAGDGTHVAVCLAIGEDNGEEVYSKPYILVCRNGVAKTLEEIYGIE